MLFDKIAAILLTQTNNSVRILRKGVRISKSTRFIRVNQQIRFSPVSVIDEEGNILGDMDNPKAQELARERGLDLVEINPTARPPVCKLMDFGKHKYDLAKKEKEQNKKQKENELKEIRLTLKISDHDLSYKAKNAREFFDRGNKVRVSLRLRGRENVFFNQAFDVFKRFSKLSGLDYEHAPIKSGNIISATVAKIKEDKEEDGKAKNS